MRNKDNEPANLEKFARFLRNQLKSKNLTATALAEALGVSRPLVSKWLAGKGKPTVKHIPTLAFLLGVDLNLIYKMLGYDIEDVTWQNVATIRVSVLSNNLPCGEPNVFYDEYIEGVIEIPVQLGIIRNPHLTYYAIRAKGDSMVGKGIMDGYMVIFTPDLEVRSGDIAVVHIETGICARIVYFKGNTIVLQPANPAYEPIVLRRDLEGIEGFENRILGRVVAVLGDPNEVYYSQRG